MTDHNLYNSNASALQVIDRLGVYAATQLPESDITLFNKFIRLYFSQMPVEDLTTRPIPDLYGTAYSHWELIRHRDEKELKIKVFNPMFEQHGWESTHTVIQVVTDDMPFLVDSMRMEMNRLKMTTHLMIFSGGMKIKRDAQGNLLDIFSYHSTNCDCCIEAPIQIEVDRQTNISVLEEISQNITRVLSDVRASVEDWQPMCARLRDSADELTLNQTEANSPKIKEVKEFLHWLVNNHFTFLGCRDYEVVGEGEAKALRLIQGSGLGVLRDDTKSKMFRQYSNLPKEAQDLALSEEQPVLLYKTNTISTVHRPAFTDLVMVKRFDEIGKLIGERRFIGLYTSEAYRMDPRHIPLVRHKVSSILKRSKLPLQSHAGKDLIHIISTLPRDDLFHATTDELYEIANGILHMQERRCTKIFIRKDAFGRFLSCLLYLPRENLNTETILKVQSLLKKTFNAIRITHTTSVSESVLAQVHYIVRVEAKKQVTYNFSELEIQVQRLTKSWEDELAREVLGYFGEERGSAILDKYRHVFPAGYREAFEPRFAVADIEHIESLHDVNLLQMTFYRPMGAPRDVIRFKLYRMGETVPLSDAVPMLENMGLRVIGEQPYQLIFQDGSEVWINDFGMTYLKEPTFEVDRVRDIFQEAFQQGWSGAAESDGFNRLVLEAQMTWREISVLRAYTKYFRQMGFVFTDQYIAETLVNNHRIAKLLVEYFKYRFNPEIVREDSEYRETLLRQIESELDTVATLDEDRLLRRYMILINATLRTNYFQLTADNLPKPYLSFKLNSAEIPDLPLPLPKCEIYVYSPRFEGVHLRAARVARGGIRWSDRREDFRTEVLGLMKAQQVKNALIVPAGAKGGFVTKCLPLSGKREQILQEGIACYQNFIRGLLDVVDNRVEGKVVKLDNTVCYDEEDPYLVVAADKGTATFSDIANLISEERNYWMGDAFASGGSTGYDHKKMAITARGAWISAQRHFQDLGINLDENEIRVVGIGDMSGDVFGNGMLMSSRIKLIAAFNHQHIFLDPNPDAMKSFIERKRLFDLPRSSWEDYNKDLISMGGGVYSRSAKIIVLSDEIRAALGIEDARLFPNDLIKAILKAPVDLLWNGGIGTYVKSIEETNDNVGDRSNDGVRVNGKDLKAKAICEGGNLGLTQLGRVEYELHGGRLNTDFIDNSAGVDCSDHEVNIKILLNDVVASGDMTCKQRNELLVTMSDEVAQLVLDDNYQQNRVISLSWQYSHSNSALFLRFIQAHEENLKLNRELEFLPADKVLLERRSASKSFTRPELSVMLAYSKNILKDDIVISNLTEDTQLSTYIEYAFPTVLREKFKKAMYSHYLARDIIATQLSNRVVSDMGTTFIYQMQDEMGGSVESIVRAYVIAREIFSLEQYNQDIEALDYKVETTLQYRMMHEGVRLVRRAVRWFLRNRRGRVNIQQNIDEFIPHVKSLYERLPKLLMGSTKERFDRHVESLVTSSVPEEIAFKVASQVRIYHALNIIEAAKIHNEDMFRVAKIYFMLVDRLDLLWFRDQINAYPFSHRWSVLAKAAYKGDLDWVQRALTLAVLKNSARSVPGKVKAWFAEHVEAIERWKSILSDLRSRDSVDFAILFVALRELVDLAEMSVDVELQGLEDIRQGGEDVSGFGSYID